MLVRDPNPATLQINLCKFFTLYCMFLRFDLTHSIYPGIRDKDILFYFYTILLDILDMDKSDHNKIDALKDFEAYLNEYIITKSKTEFEAVKEIINNVLHCNTKEINCKEEILENDEYKEKISKLTSFIENILSYIDDYSNAQKSYTKLYNKFAFTNKARITQQSINEFNNALSHINAEFLAKTNGDNRKNQERTKTHLHRGTLDLYKESIKIFLKKENNTIIREQVLMKLANIRKFEYSTLGLENARNRSKHVPRCHKEKLIVEYKELVDSLINNY